MKEALYYSIHVRCAFPHVVAVTKAKDRAWQRYGRWWGRRWYGENAEATNGTLDQLRGRFPTKEEAEQRLQGVKELAACYDARRKVIHDALHALHREEQEVTDKYIEEGA